MLRRQKLNNFKSPKNILPLKTSTRFTSRSHCFRYLHHKIIVHSTVFCHWMNFVLEFGIRFWIWSKPNIFHTIRILFIRKPINKYPYSFYYLKTNKRTFAFVLFEKKTYIRMKAAANLKFWNMSKRTGLNLASCQQWRMQLVSFSIKSSQKACVLICFISKLQGLH